MNKSLITKIFTVIVTFILIIALTITSNMAASRKDLKDLILEAYNDSWFDSNPEQVVGTKILANGNVLGYTHSRCLHPFTYLTNANASYFIVSIIDVNVNGNEIKIYNKDKSVKTLAVTDQRAIPVLVLAYLTQKSDANNETAINGGTSFAIWQIMQNREFASQLKQLGVSNMTIGTNTSTVQSLKNSVPVIKAAYNEAYRIQEEAKSGSEKASLSINMSDKQKQSVKVFEQDGKKYIGPYNLKLNNGCKIGEIKINGTINANGISTDKKNVKSVDNIKDNENFYIVTDANVNEIKNISVKATTTVSAYKARMEFLGDTYNQNYLVWNSQKTEIKPETELPVPQHGSLEIVKEDEFKDNSISLKDIGFKIYKEGSGWLDENGEFVLFKDAKEYKTDKDGKIKIDDLPLGNYRVYETSIPKSLQVYYTLNEKQKFSSSNDYKTKTEYTAKLIKKDIEITSTDPVKVTAKNNRSFVSFYIIKKDEDTQEMLDGIEFKLYKVATKNQEAGWVEFDKNNEVISTEASFDKASSLITVNGKTQEITKLPIGEYMIFETSVGPNTQYTIGTYRMPDGGLLNAKMLDKVTIKANKTGYTFLEETNKKEFIDISGIVWEDVKTGKNIKEADGLLSDEDYRINGIEVKLIDKTTGKVVVNQDGVEQKVTTKYDSKTKQNGYYKFEKVKIAELANYYVEFTYDGITYQSVVSPSEAKNNETKTKAQEKEQNRKALNDMFTELTGEGQTINGVKLSYNKESDNGQSKVSLNNISDREKGLDVNNKLVTLTKLGDFKITSQTAEKYLENRYKELTGVDGNNRVQEITNVNFGLYEREQADLALSKDISNAEISINGKTYKYNYGAKEAEVEKDVAKDVQTALGIMFKDKNPLNEQFAYSLPIYKADTVYENEDKSKELQVALTYKIGLINNSSTLNAKVNALKEMFSKDLDIEKVYTINADGTENVLYNSVTADSTGDYKQTNLNVNLQVAAGKTDYVYIIFKLPTDKIRNIVNENLFGNEEFENHAEISSYTLYSDNNTYAGYDRNSIPNNYNITNIDVTDENDSDHAPGIKVVDAGERTISGTVFEDADKDANDDERIGDGIYQDTENKVKNVEVSLVDSNGNIAATVTSENGEYELKGFIPGDYKVQFTWGEEKNTVINETPVTVDKYKSTIWTENNRKEKESSKWYLNTETRYSDALDDYELRKEIDKTTKNLMEMLNENKTDKVMKSSTNTIDIGVELKDYDEVLVNNKVKYTFDVQNVDFGIIERPIQSIEVVKDVNSMKLTAVDGETKVDFTINEQGVPEGSNVQGVKGDLAKGFINIELKNTLEPGAKAQVGYIIKVKNTSEKEYDGQDYYLYGIKDESKLITLTAENLYDYLKVNNLNAASNDNWETISNTDLQEKLQTTVLDKVTANSIANQNENADKNLFNVNDKTSNVIANWVVEFGVQNGITTVSDLEALNNEDYLNKIKSVKGKDATTYVNKDASIELKPGEEKSYNFNFDTTLTSSDIVFNNDVEIGNVIRKSDIGSGVSVNKSYLYNTAQEITVTPETGKDRNYTPVIIISISAIALLGIGIVVIKKTVLKK
ncbi:MAG: hypothetical protein IKF97_01760 [Clostridia bacterium]|nr:hypothetical protein [Clostridia bacterium]